MTSTIKIAAETLREALNKNVCDTTAAEKKYRHALIEKHGHGIRLSTTDEQMLYQVNLAADVEGELFYTANVAKMKAALAGLSGEVCLSYDSDKLILKQGKRRYSIDTLHGDVFPLVDSPFKLSVETDPIELRDAIKQVEYAAPAKDGHWFLNGVHLHDDLVVGGNNFSLAITHANTGVRIKDGIIIPKSAFKKNLLSFINEQTRIYITTNEDGDTPGSIVFEDDAQTLWVQLLYFKYPDTAARIPKAQSMARFVSFKRADALAALGRVSPFSFSINANGDLSKIGTVVLRVGDNEISVQSRDDESAVDFFPCESTEKSEGMECGFNVDLLKNMLTHIDGDNVVWHQNENRTGQAFVADDRVDTHYVAALVI